MDGRARAARRMADIAFYGDCSRGLKGFVRRRELWTMKTGQTAATGHDFFLEVT